MHTPHFLYPFDCQQTLGPLPCPGCHERRCGGRGHAAVSEALTSVLPDVYPGNGVAGSRGAYTFDFPGDFHTVLLSGCAILHPHQRGTRVPVSLHPRQPAIFSVFLVIAIFAGVSGRCTVVLICVPLMFSDVEHLFMCLFAVCFLWRNIFSHFCPFLTRLCLR